jgi:oxygen-dependent protoporphyrinogen oxidase
VKEIVVIGGGVTGLAAAYKLKRAADEGCDVSFTLVEKDGRLGGKIASEVTDDGFVVDGGPDCFLTEKPAVHRVAKLTGIEDDKLPTDEARKGTWILSRGKLHKMPDGVMMFAPTKFVPFATTGLFTWPGKIRAGMDLFIPRKERWAEGETARDHDETLESESPSNRA